MTGALPQEVITEAYRTACRLEVRTLKPGNVHVFAGGHRMTVADFDTSAAVSAPFVCDPALPVGTRIRRAVVATCDAVGQNTNLGIVLLCAPLAAAAAAPGDGSLETRLAAVLAALDHTDAAEVYAAIAYANPAGLGERASGDVRAPPPAHWTLLDAMRAAAPDDLIAAEYATNFKGVLADARAYAGDRAAGAAPDEALAALFLRRLAAQADTHIVRKHGAAMAERVRSRAAAVLTTLDLHDAAALSRPGNRTRLLALDAELKSWGANPGSHADRVCAAVFAAALAAL